MLPQEEKTPLTFEFTEKEIKVLNELAEQKGVSVQQFMRQGLSLLQAIQLGVMNVEENQDHPIAEMRRQFLPEHLRVKTRHVFKGKLVCHTEDGGQAMVGEIEDLNGHEHPEMFVRVQSWDESTNHKDLSVFKDKEIKVTVELI